MKLIFKLLILLGLSSSMVLAREIALTFDDAPMRNTAKFDGPTRAKMLIDALKNEQVAELAFFANSKMLDTEGKERLLKYANAGHLIGNHTHDHPNLNSTDTTAYIENIRTAHDELSILPGFWHAFRFPFLREGNEQKKRDAIR
jgi:peptidoglycan-N-acetylglucosamine deacetylase